MMWLALVRLLDMLLGVGVVKENHLRPSSSFATQVQDENLALRVRVPIRLEVLDDFRCCSSFVALQRVVRYATFVEDIFKHLNDLVVGRENKTLITLWKPGDKVDDCFELGWPAFEPRLVARTRFTLCTVTLHCGWTHASGFTRELKQSSHAV